MSAASMGKPLAALSSALLARKGQARPAMRSQGYGGYAPTAAAPADDLGWNDMGDPPAPVPPVVALREALSDKLEAAETSKPAAEPQARPAEPTARPISLATAERIGRDSAAQTRRGKAAFTLRLDADRHLRLRLASALSHRSAQGLVTDALDRLLGDMPDLDAMIARLPEPTRRPAGERP